MTSGHIQVGPDGGGKNMDADALTSNETGAPTVYREDVVIADPSTYGNKASVVVGGQQTPGGGALAVDISSALLEREMLYELRAIRLGIELLLAQFGVQETNLIENVDLQVT